jgi:hypothetical protein
MFLGNVFFVSLAITFALLLLLVYHFQQRFTQLERRCDLLYELSTNLVGQVKVMRSSSSTSTTNATATNGIHATATNVLFEPKADNVVPASLSKKDEQVFCGEYDSEDDDSEYDDSEEDDDQDEDQDEDDDDDDDEEDEDNEEKVVEVKLGEDPLDVVAHDLLTDIFAQGQGQGQGQEGEQEQGQEGQDEETVVVENPNKNDDTISLRSANVSQLRSQAVHLQLVSLSEAGKMKKKDLQRLLTSSTLSFASAFEVEEVVGEPPAEEV